MTWLPLPFPECSYCRIAWVEAVHSYCGGNVEVEPWQEQVNCKLCRKTWPLRESAFKCTCGHMFYAAEVSSALDGLMSVCRRLADELVENAAHIRRIRTRSEASFRGWVGGLVKSLGGAAGFVIEKLLIHFLGV